MAPRSALWLVSLLIAFFSVTGCRKTAEPNQVYERIVQTIRHGDLNASQADVEKALHQNVGGTAEWHWRFVVLKAQILVSRSEYQDALALLREDFPASLAPSEVGIRKKLMEGVAYRYGQDTANSQKALDEARTLAQSSQPQLLCEVIKAIGELEVDQKRYADADESFRQALQLAQNEKRPDQVAGVLVDLARIATSEEHFGEAIDRNQAALALSRSLDMQGLVATVLGNTAWSYFELGDYEKALNAFKEAAEVSKQIGQLGYSLYWQTGVANSYIALHKTGLAESLLADTLHGAEKLDDTETITICLNALAEIALKSDRLEQAAGYDAQALEIENAGRDHFGTFPSTLLAGRIATARRQFGEAQKLLQSVLKDPAATQPLRWEALAWLAKLHDDQGISVRAEEEYRQSIGTIEAARDSITQPELRLSFLSRGIDFYDDYVEFLVAHHRPQDALRVAELSRARTLSEGLGPAAKTAKVPFSDSQFQESARRAAATLLFYWVGSRHSYLWAITPKKIAYFTLPSAPEIDAVLLPYLEAVAGSKDVAATDGPAGTKLYGMLVGPAQQLLPKDGRVVLLPDGNLDLLNFEALLVPQPQPHFWVEDVTLNTANSLSLLASGMDRRPLKEKKLLLVGDALKVSEDFAPLAQASDEMQMVQRYFPALDTLVLRRGQATPKAYLDSHPERFAYLHFVTHGTASRAWPLESSVILSKEADGESYKLYARDIVTHHLDAELVTISACNGSGTRAYSGEGLVGLSWAFLRAGAHNVIGALWEVSDSSTPRLMDKLYSGLSQGKDPASALRDAKLSLLHSNSVYRKPFYWAPFQLYSGS